MEDCIFCKIINKEIPSAIIYEDEKVIAFNDINPVAPVHVLVIPKIHISCINDINSENSKYIEQVYIAIAEVAKIVKVDEAGYRVINNCGEDGGQVVNHLHFHLLGGKHLGSKLVQE